MEFSTLLYAVKDRIATVTINRPDKLNAVNAVAKTELRDLFASLKHDGSVDVVIITGSGEKAFVAGTDIKELTGIEWRERGKNSRPEGTGSV